VSISTCPASIPGPCTMDYSAPPDLDDPSQFGHLDLTLSMSAPLSRPASLDGSWKSSWETRDAAVQRLRLNQAHQEAERSQLSYQQKAAEVAKLTALLEKLGVEKGRALDERDAAQRKLSQARACCDAGDCRLRACCTTHFHPTLEPLGSTQRFVAVAAGGR